MRLTNGAIPEGSAAVLCWLLKASMVGTGSLDLLIRAHCHCPILQLGESQCGAAELLHGIEQGAPIPWWRYPEQPRGSEAQAVMQGMGSAPCSGDHKAWGQGMTGCLLSPPVCPELTISLGCLGPNACRSTSVLGKCSRDLPLQFGELKKQKMGWGICLPPPAALLVCRAVLDQLHGASRSLQLLQPELGCWTSTSCSSPCSPLLILPHSFIVTCRTPLCTFHCSSA